MVISFASLDEKLISEELRCWRGGCDGSLSIGEIGGGEPRYEFLRIPGTRERMSVTLLEHSFSSPNLYRCAGGRDSLPGAADGSEGSEGSCLYLLVAERLGLAACEGSGLH